MTILKTNSAFVIKLFSILFGGRMYPKLRNFKTVCSELAQKKQNKGKSPGTDPIKILQRKFYATQFYQTFWLGPIYFQPTKMLEK